MLLLACYFFVSCRYLLRNTFWNVAAAIQLYDDGNVVGTLVLKPYTLHLSEP